MRPWRPRREGTRNLTSFQGSRLGLFRADPVAIAQTVRDIPAAMGNPLQKAASLVKHAKCLIITSGAGLGVDSGLPDFRGENGFLKDYAPFKRAGVNYMDVSRFDNFMENPGLGWGFYAFRAKLYRETTPHDGFRILQSWISERQLKYFAVTSNVDGHFQKAGFPADRVYEVHGSIHHQQCAAMCTTGVWESNSEIEINSETMRVEQVPACPKCGGIARPNVQFFTDYGWVKSRCDEQGSRFREFWQRVAPLPTVVIEIGAGSTAPNIRIFSLALAQRANTRLIRINPREPNAPSPHLSVRMGGLEALRQIDTLLRS